MVELLNVDCMAYMATLPDNAFDIAVVDPPYGIGAGKTKVYNSSVIESLTNYKPKSWDAEVPSSEYWKELFRVSKSQIVWGGNYFSEHLISSKNWIIWDKVQPEEMHFSQAEMAWMSFGNGIRIFKKSIASCSNKVSNNKVLAQKYIRIHPTQKPKALYQWIFKNYVQPGWKILDTHLGSGSSAIAAYHMGFDFVGCEIDKDYFDQMQARYKRETDEGMFAAAAPQAKQLITT